MALIPLLNRPNDQTGHQNQGYIYMRGRAVFRLDVNSPGAIATCSTTSSHHDRCIMYRQSPISCGTMPAMPRPLCVSLLDNLLNSYEQLTPGTPRSHPVGQAVKLSLGSNFEPPLVANTWHVPCSLLNACQMPEPSSHLLSVSGLSAAVGSAAAGPLSVWPA